jgi:hypothetical protein
MKNREINVIRHKNDWTLKPQGLLRRLSQASLNMVKNYDEINNDFYLDAFLVRPTNKKNLTLTLIKHNRQRCLFPNKICQNKTKHLLGKGK